ncbi:hypothetical protein P154DRAFT_610155 [Amniculicola lignicola CBS 123094]|uniref:Fucose-specific lectin n=1 Tax=Amniculicola lignicola CBS 123094 TaxID=1392246 RepID=A0A6A5W3R3_9PLEO|nr:hypothetical protein P154DRAFT_610155 [Amniculicola lignicola CBS 123094]
MKSLGPLTALAIFATIFIPQLAASILHVRNESDISGAFAVSQLGLFEELSVHPTIVSRDDIDPPASDDAWEAFKCKGTTLFSMMSSSDQEAGQLLEPPRDSAASKFTSFPDAYKKWFWHYFEFDMTDLGEGYYGIADALKGLKVSTQKSDWKFWRVTHGDLKSNWKIDEQKYDTDGRSYRATGSSFIILVNTKDGILVVAWAFGPKVMAAQRNPPVTTLPDLKQTSDIVYGCWAMSGGNANLNHIINWGITNKATQTAIGRIMRDSQISYVSPWPGIQVAADGDAGKGLLGTPTGVGVGFMLAQHKDVLGNRTVKGVRVFEGNSIAWEQRTPPMIYWSIGAA